MPVNSKLSEFTVEGNGDFPLDMLRYDQCWPKSESTDSINVAARRYTSKRQVTLVSIKRLPTIARWESFGWKVVKINGK